jgi:hypothetical protein
MIAPEHRVYRRDATGRIVGITETDFLAIDDLAAADALSLVPGAVKACTDVLSRDIEQELRKRGHDGEVHNRELVTLHRMLQSAWRLLLLGLKALWTVPTLSLNFLASSRTVAPSSCIRLTA